MKLLILLFLICSDVTAKVELMVVGDQNHPVQFVALPFTYHGAGYSPAITVENHLIQALSSTGLFSMPFRYEKPVDAENMLGWQLAGIRYVLQGDLYEVEETLSLRLTISDSLGLQPTISRVILNPKQLELSSQMYADQVYRSLFYATFTNDNDKQYLDNENPTLTRYLNQLVVVFKSAWHSSLGTGTCTVNIQQMPGGLPFKSKLQEDCFIEQLLAEEIKVVLDEIDVLPYQEYQDVFEKSLTIQFISLD